MANWILPDHNSPKVSGSVDVLPASLLKYSVSQGVRAVLSLEFPLRKSIEFVEGARVGTEIDAELSRCGGSGRDRASGSAANVSQCVGASEASDQSGIDDAAGDAAFHHEIAFFVQIILLGNHPVCA